MKKKHWYDVGSKIAQSEEEKGRGAWFLLALLVIMAVLGGSFLGFFLETQLVNPPVQVIGICPHPAFVQGDSCVTQTCSANQQGQQACNTQPAGYIVGESCAGSVCVGVGGNRTT